MRILYDLSSAQPQGNMIVNGGGEYSLTVLNSALEKLEDNILFVLLNNDLLITPEMNDFLQTKNVTVLLYSSNRDIENFIREYSINRVVFPVCYNKYYDLNVSDEVELITVIHDLSAIYTNTISVKYGRYLSGKWFKLLRQLRRNIKNKKISDDAQRAYNKVVSLNLNQKIITDSYYSKSSLVKYLDIDDKKVDVVYCPIKEHIFNYNDVNLDRVLQTYKLKQKKFFLLSSGCRWTKNNAIVLFTLDRMFSDNKYNHILCDDKVIVLGTNTKYKQYYLENIKNKERFVFEDYVSNEVLNCLYDTCRAFIYPSVLEGFGYPPIEVMKHNSISVCSTAMSIPEICGDAVIYMNPQDEVSIEIAILQVYDNELVDEKRIRSKKWLQELEKRQERDLNRLIKIIVE